MKWKQLWVYNEGNHLNFNGPFGPYFRELFFHIPFLIANHLNANQKFKEAKYWYDKIFDPTQDNPWQYIEFREAGKATFQKILSDTAALKAYEKDPFSPHAIARKRISAYQKAVVMKYIDNLLDWGDHLFTQDTFETINEALMLYVLAYDLLGERPKQIGQCERPADRVLTYGHIQPYLPPDPKHEQPAPYLIEMKNWQQRYYRKMITAHFEGAQANNGKPWEYQIPDGLRFNYRYPEDIITAHPPTKPEPVPVDQVQPANPPAAQLFWSAPTRIAETYRGYAERKTPAPQSGNLAVDRMPQGYKPAPEQSIGRQETLYIEDRQEQVFCVPPNPNLLEYWNRVEDRLYKIRHCMNIKGVRRTLLLWEPEIDPGLLVAAKAKGVGLEDVIVMLQGELPPYRFAFMLEKARSFAATVSSFGSALLSALEKKDGEELALIKSRQEQNVLKLTRTIKKKQVEEAKAKWEALLEGKKQVQQKIDYYQDLISNGLIAGEHTQQDLTHWATARLGTSILYYFFGAKADLFPKILGFAFSTPAWGAEKASEKVAKVYDLISSILKSAAEAAGLEAHYERRAQEWHQQLKLTEQELVQTKKQTLAAKIAHQITEKDQEIHEKNIEQSKELYDFYQDKFTALGLYNYLATSLSRLYREAYGLALRMARQAERCYQFERDDDKIFIEGGNWEAGRAGLLAGEKLLLQLQEMEQAYLENNVRDYEVTQSFSMLMLDPEALINLQKLGKCEFTIPEIAYDLFYPGQYKRMIKAVRVTIPSVAGPYQNVPCKLTLESSKVRRGATSDGKELIHAPKGWCKSIATSTATNDGGLFELNFRDERYLPFEGAGAVESKWILQLPKTICPFDYDTISDVIIHISYTAKEDEVFREKKEAEIRNELSKNTLYRLFDLKHEFPEVLHQLEQAKENVALRITKDHFPQYLKDLTFSPKSASILKVVGKKLDDNDKAVIAGVQGDQGQNIDGSWDIKLKKDYLEDGNVLVLLKYGVQYANA